MSADTYLPLEVDQDMRTAIGGAFESRNFVTVGYLGDDGYAHISRRGTVQVYGDQQLALWARKRDDGLARAVASRPELTLLYVDMRVPQLYTFYGKAEVSSDPRVADTVYANSPERERAQDPERAGVPVIVELERIEALGASRFVMKQP
jgi:hypothetical protein